MQAQVGDHLLLAQREDMNEWIWEFWCEPAVEKPAADTWVVTHQVLD
jgi:hypothetical protein